MKIRTSVSLITVFTFLSLIIVAGTGFVIVDVLEKDLNKIYQISEQSNQLMNDILHEAVTHRRYEKDMILNIEDNVVSLDFSIKFRNTIRNMEKLFQEIEVNLNSLGIEKQYKDTALLLYTNAKEAHDKYVNGVGSIIMNSLEYDTINSQLLALQVAEYESDINNFELQIKNLAGFKKKVILQIYNYKVDKVRVYRVVMILVTMIVAISLAISLLFHKKHTLKGFDLLKVRMVDMKNISNSNFEPLEWSDEDEIGELVALFNGVLVELIELNTLISESEEKLNTTLMSIGDGVIVVDKNDKILRMNKVAEEITEWKFSEALGRHSSDVVFFENSDNGSNEGPLDQVLKTGKIEFLPENTCMITKNKNKKIISDSKSPIKDKEGRLFGAVMVFRDITEEMELRKQIQHQDRMDAIGQLTGGLAHDFNNILTGIIGASEVILDLEKKNKTVLEYVNIIHEASIKAADLNSKLLSFSRKGKNVSTAIYLHEIVNESLMILEHSIDKKIKINIQLNAQKDIIVGDPSQIQNIIINLGINARDAMPDGGTLEIKTCNKTMTTSECQKSLFKIDPGDYIELSVKDTGTGIDPDLVKKIFEPFFTTKEVGKGTGLGLSAVLGAMEEHCGSINVLTEVGKGTLFKLNFPLSDKRIIEKINIDNQVYHGNGKILVVDDEPVLRRLAKTIIGSLGYKVILAENGKEAIDVYRKQKDDIDLVILDMVMPVMGGEECFMELEEINSEIKVIMASGFSMDSNIQELKELGIKEFISKPYQKITLSKIIKKVLSL